jgi:putative ubiquitin-RnfH superfamily antitoxin RatB of RatAB toxin-antitoxin module
MDASSRVAVSVVYATPDRQTVVSLNVPAKSTVADVVAASGLLARFPEIDRSPKCAIFGRPVALTGGVLPGDRVEILRPLAIDPKEGRRRAAAQAREIPP